MERAVLHEQRGDGAAVLVEAGLDDGALRGAVRVGLELLHLGGQDDHLEQLIDAHARLGRDRADDGVAAPLLGDEVVFRELLLDVLGVCAVLIHFVDRDDNGDVCGLGVVDGLDGLRHDAIVRRNDQNGDVGAHGAAGTHGGEGGVARRVKEGDGLAVDLDGVGADVLRDAAGLAGDDVRLADGVEQARLAVVDVAHDDDDRAARDELVRGVLMIVNEALLNGHNDLALDLAAHLRGDEFRRVEVDGLVDRGHDAVLEQGLDDLGRGLLHAGGQLADGDLIGDLHGQRGLLDDLQAQAAHLLLLLVALLRAEGRLLAALGLILVLAGDLLLAAGEILRALGDEHVHAVVKAVGIDGDGRGIDDAALALALLLLGLGGLVGALRSGRGICGRSAALCGLGCGLRGLGLLRLGLLCLRGHGEHLLQRSDLVLLRDHVEHNVQLLVRQHLRVAARLLKIFSNDLRNILRRHAKVSGDLLHAVFHKTHILATS